MSLALLFCLTRSTFSPLNDRWCLLPDQKPRRQAQPSPVAHPFLQWVCSSWLRLFCVFLKSNLTVLLIWNRGWIHWFTVSSWLRSEVCFSLTRLWASPGKDSFSFTSSMVLAMGAWWVFNEGLLGMSSCSCFQSGCSIFIFPVAAYDSPVALHPYEHLVWLAILAILVGIRGFNLYFPHNPWYWASSQKCVFFICMSFFVKWLF